MYNLINMLFLPWLGGRPVYKAYNCSEFIAKIIEKAGIPLHRPYYQYMPRYLSELLEEYLIFEGTLDNDVTFEEEDDFFKETPGFEYFIKTCYILKELMYRQIFKRPSKHYNWEYTRLKSDILF